MSNALLYRPVEAETYETTVQDAVDLVWFSFHDEDPIVVEERLGDTVTAVWIVPHPYESDAPPIASLSHRVEI